MATVIRLTRMGRKNSPFYRVVLCDKKFARDGRFIEILGNYNPFTKKFVINKDKVEKYRKNGTKVSTVVERLLKTVE